MTPLIAKMPINWMTRMLSMGVVELDRGSFVRLHQFSALDRYVAKKGLLLMVGRWEILDCRGNCYAR